MISTAAYRRLLGAALQFLDDAGVPQELVDGVLDAPQGWGLDEHSAAGEGLGGQGLADLILACAESEATDLIEAISGTSIRDHLIMLNGEWFQAAHKRLEGLTT